MENTTHDTSVAAYLTFRKVHYPLHLTGLAFSMCRHIGLHGSVWLEIKGRQDSQYTTKTSYCSRFTAHTDARAHRMNSRVNIEAFRFPEKKQSLLFFFVLFLFFSFFLQKQHLTEWKPTSDWSPRVPINPFSAPACKISGLKDASTRLQMVYFPVL